MKNKAPKITHYIISAYSGKKVAVYDKNPFNLINTTRVGSPDASNNFGSIRNIPNRTHKNKN